MAVAAPPTSVPRAPPAPQYSLCTPEEWDRWYTDLNNLIPAPGGMHLLDNVAHELRNEGVPFAEKWGEQLTDLQLGRLRLKLREADVRLDDISVAEDAYKDKKREWWFAEGPKYIDRLLNKFRPRVRDYLSPEMICVMVLSPTECREVVQNASFADWEKELDSGDYKSAAEIIAPSTVFGKRLTRAWIFFRQDASAAKVSKVRKLNSDDKDRPRLDAAFLRLTQLWEAHTQSELKALYPNRRSYPPIFGKFHARLHECLCRVGTRMASLAARCGPQLF